MPPSKHVIGPDGRRLTLADLPSPNTKRWVVRRKAQVVAAVRGGLLSLEEACSRYALNADEFQAWQRCIDSFGIAGLRTTCTQFYLNFEGSEGLVHQPAAFEPARSLAISYELSLQPQRKKRRPPRPRDRSGC